MKIIGLILVSLCTSLALADHQQNARYEITNLDTLRGYIGNRGCENQANPQNAFRCTEAAQEFCRKMYGLPGAIIQQMNHQSRETHVLCLPGDLSRGVPMDTLNRLAKAGNCTMPLNDETSLGCTNGAFRFCSNEGETGGYPQRLRIGQVDVLCTGADVLRVSGTSMDEEVFKKTGVCFNTTPSWHPWAWLQCNSAASVYCRNRGYVGGGIVGKRQDTAVILCSR